MDFKFAKLFYLTRAICSTLVGFELLSIPQSFRSSIGTLLALKQKGLLTAMFIVVQELYSLFQKQTVYLNFQ